MSDLSLSDMASAELDLRKAQSLVEQGTISAEEIKNAEIVLACECGLEQPISNDVCPRCGKDLS